MASLEGRSMHRIDSRSVIVPCFSYYGIEDDSSLVSYCLDGVMVFVCKACLVKAQREEKKLAEKVKSTRYFRYCHDLFVTLQRSVALVPLQCGRTVSLRHRSLPKVATGLTLQFNRFLFQHSSWIPGCVGPSPVDLPSTVAVGFLPGKTLTFVPKNEPLLT